MAGRKAGHCFLLMSFLNCFRRNPNLNGPVVALLVPGLLACALLAACRSPLPEIALHRYEFKDPHMGTVFSIVMHAPNVRQASEAATAAFQRIAALEDVMSDYQADSELNLLCAKPVGAPVPLSEDLFDVLRCAERISVISEGAFDVTVGPYVRLWRFARKRKVLPAPEEIAQARIAVGWKKLKIDERTRTATLLAPAMRLDLGGIAKGYAADQALKELRARGMGRALVAASGDIAIGDPPPGEQGWKIGIAGWKAEESPSTILLHNCGISTSGDTEQFIEIDGVRYSHIVSTVTGLGLTERIQVTVIAHNATTTDGLATAVSALGREAGLRLVEKQPGVAALVLIPGNAGEVGAFPSKRFKKLPKVLAGASALVR